MPLHSHGWLDHFFLAGSFGIRCFLVYFFCFPHFDVFAGFRCRWSFKAGGDSLGIGCLHLNPLSQIKKIDIGEIIHLSPRPPMLMPNGVHHPSNRYWLALVCSLRFEINSYLSTLAWDHAQFFTSLSAAGGWVLASECCNRWRWRYRRWGYVWRWGQIIIMSRRNCSATHISVRVGFFV